MCSFWEKKKKNFTLALLASSTSNTWYPHVCIADILVFPSHSYVCVTVRVRRPTDGMGSHSSVNIETCSNLLQIQYIFIPIYCCTQRLKCMRFDERTPHTPLLPYSLRFHSIASSFHWLHMGMIYWLTLLGIQRFRLVPNFSTLQTNQSISMSENQSQGKIHLQYTSFFRFSFFFSFENESKKKKYSLFVRTNQRLTQ